MSKVLQVRNPNDYARYLGVEERHPLVCVVNYEEVSPIRHSLNNYGVYGLFLRDDAKVNLNYGRGRYDYQKGSLICVAPGQIGGKEDNGEQVSITGWALLFHPDLLHGSFLEKTIKDLSFFDYHVNEALHMSDEEHDTLVSLMRQIQDETTGETASSHIRQFVVRLAKNNLAAGDRIAQVSYKLGFEYPQHLSRMFKKQTGMSPTEYIRSLRLEDSSDSRPHL